MPHAIPLTPRHALLAAAMALPLFAIRTRPAEVQTAGQAGLRQAALVRRADDARLDAGLKATLRGNGMTLIHTDKDAFRTALTAFSFYTGWPAKFGDQAWAALQPVSGDLA